MLAATRKLIQLECCGQTLFMSEHVSTFRDPPKRGAMKNKPYLIFRSLLFGVAQIRFVLLFIVISLIYE